jgi:membrane protease YdiL (CAAX protease family)
MASRLSDDRGSGAFSGILAVVRALIAAVLVTEAGLLAWVGLIVLLPPILACVAMPGVLVVYWFVFSGRLPWPGETRRRNFRRTSLARVAWFWGLAAAALFVVGVEASIFTLFRLIPFPAEQFAPPAALGQATTTQLWVLAVVASLVAGVCEETGFRGYMQRPLELRFGPAWAIALTTAGFAALHLNQAWVVTLLVPLLLASVMLGALAYVAQSLIPGIIAHAVMDVFNFSFWWWHLWGHYDSRPVTESGLDVEFLLAAGTLLISLTLFVLTVRKLAASTSIEESPNHSEAIGTSA